LITTQKDTPAFTSIFTYIAGLKAQNPSKIVEIDAITTNEDIAPITDIYGTGRTNRMVNSTPLYANLLVGSSVNIRPNYSATSTEISNRLGTHNFVKFSISSERVYKINISGTSGVNLNFFAFKEGSSNIAMTGDRTGQIASGQANLTVGTYRMYVTDTKRVPGVTLSVTLN